MPRNAYLPDEGLTKVTETSHNGVSKQRHTDGDATYWCAVQ